MEEAVTAFLLADAKLSSLISSRVHWGRLPQTETRPYLILTLASATVDMAQSGRTGWAQSRLQLDGYAESASASKAISMAAFEVLEKARHRQAGVKIHSAIIDTIRDYLPVSTAGAALLYRNSIDLFIWHSR
ncbi:MULTISPECIES: tail completion protein gp17 [Rhizobium/Agrobacterium group]|uniref:DUF3168 domain-containing protein n=1 Tax=Allorhizobium ampelinum (strain ATCC BAA-846 / DSM 112012 / S4) TaxID=311402 RepID=B9K2S8_ALLAM|nr:MULTISPECIES: DUF3168 domain-containing protein [Rhizobium/Agrobacterium group]ACM39176.1 hypothetical protein Avi_6192 [Allorhizobium ampelinum S4]MUO27192.1 DUF3168 domain-containing protein [Agrobacterium vitis]